MRILIVALAILLLVVAASWWMRSSFLGSLQQRIATVKGSQPAAVEQLDRLPPLVRQYLERSGVEPGRQYRYFHIAQTGQMKLAEDGDWQPYTAEQWFAVARPAFVWKPRMPMPVGSIVGSDWLDGDKGGLQMRLFGAIPVATDEGPTVAEGELARYLAELPWNPAAMAANEAITWTQDDARHATATLTVGELSATVTFEFDDEGDIASVRSKGRPRGSGENLERVPWGGEFSEYGRFDGVRVPTRAQVFWEEADGRFTYWKGQISAVDWE